METARRSDRWYGLGDVDPDFYYDTEQFQCEESFGDVQIRQRPKRVAGAVWNVGGRSRGELFALADFRPNGTLDLGSPSYSVGGHLIAVMLTGLDQAWNIVPVSKATNDRMSRVESAIGKLAHYPHWLEIDVSYQHHENPRIPSSFDYRLYEGGTRPDDRVDPIETWTVAQGWISGGRFDFEPSALNQVERLKLMLKFGWKIENSTPFGFAKLKFLEGHLPPPDQRPLAFVDYWIIAQGGGGSGPMAVTQQERADYINSIELGAPFSKLNWVRSFAIRCNILSHDNWLVSDAYGVRSASLESKEGVVIETQEQLVIGGGANAPQLDHIIPQSLNGPNCFSNAQVTSQQYNASKQDKTEQFAYRSLEWKREKLQELKDDPLVKYFG